MNNAYEYDVEIYPNLFEVTFIPKIADQKLIDVYKAVDIRCLAIKNGKEGNLEELKEAKAKLLLAIGAKQFVIWIDYTTGKWRNDGPLIMDFFIQHKNPNYTYLPKILLYHFHNIFNNIFNCPYRRPNQVEPMAALFFCARCCFKIDNAPNTSVGLPFSGLR